MTMEDHSLGTSLDVAPLISDAKAALAWRRFLGTVLGGVRTVPGMPFKMYLLQLLLWSCPILLCTGTILLVPEEPRFLRFLVGGAASALFTLAVEALRFWLHQRAIEPGAPKAAWFSDDDALDFENFSPNVVEFLLPRKRPAFLALAALLSAALGAVAPATLGPRALQLRGLDLTTALVVSAWAQLSLATAAYGLHGEAPVELCGGGSPAAQFASRPLLVASALGALVAGVGTAWMLVVVALLPLVWALGLVTPVDFLLHWALDQVEVHVFGGTAASDVRRLALSVVASAASAAALAAFCALGPRALGLGLGLEGLAAAGGALSLLLAALLSPLPPRARDLPKAVCKAATLLLQACLAAGVAAALLFLALPPDALLALRLSLEQVCLVVSLLAVHGVSAWRLSARVCGLRRPGYANVRATMLWGERGRPPESPLPRRSSRVSEILAAAKAQPEAARGMSIGAEAGAKASRGVTWIYVGLEAFVRILLLAHLVVTCVPDALASGEEGLSVEGSLACVLVLRQARVVMSQTPRAALDTWLAGLVSLSLPTWPHHVHLFLVSVLRQRAQLLLAHLRYALHLCWVTAALPKLRHPLTGPLLWTNALLFPGLLLVLAAAAVLEAPLLTMFTLPLFAVGGLRPRQGLCELSSSGAVEKGVEGLFYSSLEPSLLRGLAKRFRCQALPTEPGSVLLCRSHERLLCLVRVLASGFGWAEVELRGLEMQEPTSCHHVEAGRIDDAFAAAFGDEPRRTNEDDPASRLQPFLLEALAEMPAMGYEQTVVSLRGLLDNPETLRQVHRLFLKALVWVLWREARRRDWELPPGWLNCPLKSQDAQAALNLITTASWPRDVADALAPSAPDLRAAGDAHTSHPGLDEVYVDSPRSDPRSDGQYRPDSPPLPPGSPPVIRPEGPERAKSTRPSASPLRIRATTTSSTEPADAEMDAKDEDLDVLMEQVLELAAPERGDSGRSGAGASKNVRKLLSASSADAESQRLPLVSSGPALRPVLGDFFDDRSPSKGSVTPKATGSMQLKALCSRTPDPEERSPSGNSSPNAWKASVDAGERLERPQDRVAQAPAELAGLAKIVVEAYVAVNVAPAFGQIPESLGMGHVLRIFAGVITQGTQVPELQWLAGEPELLRLTLKAFRYALKISVDCVALGEDLTDLEYSAFADAAAELDRTWFLGPEGSQKWEVAMRQRVPNLMALRRKGTSEVQVLRLRLTEDCVRIARVRPSVLQSLWASAAFELRYLANDDDERYSIQAHPTLFRNLVVQSAEYPIYVSPPITLWL